MTERYLISELSERLRSPIDLLICSASFEERSTVIPLAIERDKPTKVLVFLDPKLTGTAGRAHCSSIESHYGEKTSVVELDLRKPLNIADAMLSAFHGTNAGRCRILVDVTTFTHESLLILLRVLELVTFEEDVVTAVYVGATEYAVGMPFEKKWLTRGVAEIRSVLGYAGESIPTQSRHLILLAGFEVERAEEVIEAYEPTALSIGFGAQLSSITRNHYELNRKYYEKIVSNHANVSSFSFSPEAIESTVASVENQVALFPEHNTVIAPLNTKISTIGVGLTALRNSSLQVCYAVPEEYNVKNYSAASDQIYSFDIPMGSRVQSFKATSR